jgi:hypothetical protein
VLGFYLSDTELLLLGPPGTIITMEHSIAKAPEVEEYSVVEAPEGAVVDALPEGYEVEIIDGKEYYVLDDVYYAEVEADEFDDKIGYEVVIP